MSDHPNVDVVARENARRGIMGSADQKIQRAAGHPYRVPKHPVSFCFCFFALYFLFILFFFNL